MTTSVDPKTSGPPSGGPESTDHRSDGAPPPPHSRRGLVIGAAVIAVLLIALLAVGVSRRSAQGKRLGAAVASASGAVPVVSVMRLVVAPSNPTVILPGTLQPMLTTAVYARTPGYLRRIMVDIGMRVRAGDLLAVIDAPDLDQQVMQARGMVSQTRASLQLATAELARWRALSAGGAVTADELDQKMAAFNVATANLNAAQADLQRLLYLQSFERVVAPFSGVITQRNVDPGALVATTGSASTALATGSGSATGSLFQIAKVDSLRMFVSVPEEYSMQLRVGTAAVVTVPQLPRDTLQGRVTKTARALDPSTRTLLAEVDVANRNAFYLPGMYAQAQLRIAQVAAPIQLPATGMVIRAGPPQVVIVGPDSRVRYQNVQIGRDHGAWLEVTGGLAVGTTIVVNPPDNLRDGVRVRTIPADTTGTTAPPSSPTRPVTSPPVPMSPAAAASPAPPSVGSRDSQREAVASTPLPERRAP